MTASRRELLRLGGILAGASAVVAASPTAVVAAMTSRRFQKAEPANGEAIALGSGGHMEEHFDVRARLDTLEQFLGGAC
jgi:cyanophycinase-like exopeptidase